MDLLSDHVPLCFLEDSAPCGVEAGPTLARELLLSFVPLSLYCTELLVLIFPPLPVFASGGWGVNVGQLLLPGAAPPLPHSGPGKWHSPQADSGVTGEVCRVCVSKCLLFGLLCVCAYFFYFGLTNPHASRWFLS